MLKLSIYCTKFESNVVVQVGAVKIYVAAAVQALRKKETQDETQFTTKNWWKN
jgi:hypothetical protein